MLPHPVSEGLQCALAAIFEAIGSLPLRTMGSKCCSAITRTEGDYGPETSPEVTQTPPVWLDAICVEATKVDDADAQHGCFTISPLAQAEATAVPASSISIFDRAVALQAKGDDTEARALYRSVVADNPNHHGECKAFVRARECCVSGVCVDKCEGCERVRVCSSSSRIAVSVLYLWPLAHDTLTPPA